MQCLYVGGVFLAVFICLFVYSQSSRKQPPWKFEKVVVTRAARLQD